MPGRRVPDPDHVCRRGGELPEALLAGAQIRLGARSFDGCPGTLGSLLDQRNLGGCPAPRAGRDCGHRAERPPFAPPYCRGHHRAHAQSLAVGTLGLGESASLEVVFDHESLVKYLLIGFGEIRETDFGRKWRDGVVAKLVGKNGFVVIRPVIGDVAAVEPEMVVEHLERSIRDRIPVRLGAQFVRQLEQECLPFLVLPCGDLGMLASGDVLQGS